MSIHSTEGHSMEGDAPAGGRPATGRPAADEYAAFFAPYVDLVPETDIDEVLAAQLGIVDELIRGLGETAADYRYAPGKWCLREVLGHVIDAEWVFSSRAFWFARGGPSPLPGMDQDVFAAAADYAVTPVATLRHQFESVRRAGLSQFRTFSSEVRMRRGTASDCEFTVRGLLYIIAGHLRHHLRVIDECYLRRPR